MTDAPDAFTPEGTTSGGKAGQPKKRATATSGGKAGQPKKRATTTSGGKAGRPKKRPTTTSGSAARPAEPSVAEPSVAEASAYEAAAYNASAYVPAGYEVAAYVASAYVPAGYEAAAYDASAYLPAGYDAMAYESSAYLPAGYDATAYPATGYDTTGYDTTGYETTGYETTGYLPHQAVVSVPVAHDPESVAEVLVAREEAARVEAAEATTGRTLAGLDEVRDFFRTRTAPIFFVGATPMTLLGLDRWVPALSYVTYYDAWDGAHPRVFTPAVKPYVDFRSAEEVTNWLLVHPEVQAYIAGSTDPGARPGIVTVAADEETERLCAERGYDLLLSPALLRGGAYAAVMADAQVDEWAGYSSLAVEAVVTRKGTVVGPTMTGLTGRPELTPVAGGWCGDELRPGTLTGGLREKATALVRQVGSQLQCHGYRGYFEVDLLVDADADAVHLGDLMLGVSGATPLTHLSAVASADVPLFLFHLLELLDMDVDVDVEELNRRWAELAVDDDWTLIAVKETGAVFEQISVAAPTGQYALGADGALTFRHGALDWHQLQDETEAFFLRIYGPGNYRWQGADLGVLVTRGSVREAGEQPWVLTPRAQAMVDAIRAQYAGTSLALVS